MLSAPVKSALECRFSLQVFVYSTLECPRFALASLVGLRLLDTASHIVPSLSHCVGSCD